MVRTLLYLNDQMIISLIIIIILEVEAARLVTSFLFWHFNCAKKKNWKKSWLLWKKFNSQKPKVKIASFVLFCWSLIVDRCFYFLWWSREVIYKWWTNHSLLTKVIFFVWFQPQSKWSVTINRFYFFIIISIAIAKSMFFPPLLGW